MHSTFTTANECVCVYSGPGLWPLVAVMAGRVMAITVLYESTEFQPPRSMLYIQTSLLIRANRVYIGEHTHTHTHTHTNVGVECMYTQGTCILRTSAVVTS